ncbi:hypothetical protein KP509_08G059900 [Ceratopteris richardii]|uniref:J domain-containing protein n=1 Tax=Ceratopteris richardii TaxID=49495 RepID=A0A8T2UAF2_CERRI|nr:hypothetical protein KP509_08G059900 [Ceratopteris richardii]
MTYSSSVRASLRYATTNHTLYSRTIAPSRNPDDIRPSQVSMSATRSPADLSSARANIHTTSKIRSSVDTEDRREKSRDWQWPRLPSSVPEKKRSLYEVLGLPSEASEEEIRNSYRKLALKFHPDRVAPEKRDECTQLFCEIRAAYEILADCRARSGYDASQNLVGFRTVLRPTSSMPTKPQGNRNAHVPQTSWTRYGPRWETDQCW